MSGKLRNITAQSSVRGSEFIPGGVSSINRMVLPLIAFDHGEGAYMWDSNGNKYIDFHAAFAPHLLGHNNDEINGAVIRTLRERKSLFGSGPTDIECDLAALLCNEIEPLEMGELGFFVGAALDHDQEALGHQCLDLAILGDDHFLPFYSLQAAAG